MSSSRQAPPVDLSMLLNQAGYALANRLTAALGELDMSVRVYCVLAKAAEGEYTQGRLAELAWMDKTTMVVTLDEMERHGLAERRLSPEDRRVRVIAITEEGRAQLARADEIAQRVYDDVLGDVPARRREAFIEVLAGLVEGPLAAPFHMEARTRRRAQRSVSV
jgi:MarR family transcriptional regulator, transcriptional regulator for hemolysin